MGLQFILRQSPDVMVKFALPEPARRTDRFSVNSILSGSADDAA
jgi:hypothetical protein